MTPPALESMVSIVTHITSIMISNGADGTLNGFMVQLMASRDDGFDGGR